MVAGKFVRNLDMDTHQTMDHMVLPPGQAMMVRRPNSSGIPDRHY